MSHDHFIIKCKKCDVVLNQCRCMSKDKEIIKISHCSTCAHIIADGTGSKEDGEDGWKAKLLQAFQEGNRDVIGEHPDEYAEWAAKIYLQPPAPQVTADDLLLAAEKNLLNAVLRLLEADPHHFTTRPCQTCTAVSAIAGKSFGCKKKAEGSR